MKHEDALEYATRIARENREKRPAQIANAKASAPPNKEPLDVERVKRESRTSALGIMTALSGVRILEFSERR